MSALKMNLSGTAQLAYWRSFKTASFLSSKPVVAAMFKAGAVMHEDLARNSFSGRVKPSGMFMESVAGNQLAARTGATRSRLTMDVLIRGTEILAVVGSPDKHVLANEIGAVITPKSSKMLAVPTRNIMTPTGALKAEWVSKLAGGGWRGIWESEGLFVWRGKRKGTKGAWIARKHGSGIQLLAYLVPSVTLIARYPVRKSAQRVSPKVASIIGAGVGTAMRGKP